VNCYINQHAELSSKYTQKYDYQQARCDDPELFQEWFCRFSSTIKNYGIAKDDIYNMDETGFQIGMISTAKVICGADIRDSRAKAVQPGNRE
jgi:hypothetical protein